MTEPRHSGEITERYACTNEEGGYPFGTRGDRCRALINDCGVCSTCTGETKFVLRLVERVVTPRPTTLAS